MGPLFRPGAGSAASAGMTEMARADMTVERAEADLVVACATSVPGAGRFPLGGGNDGKKGAGMTGGGAGMTGGGGGCDERGGGNDGREGAGMTGDGGETQPWCCSRRDTRGKRGYDGAEARVWRRWGAGMAEEVGREWRGTGVRHNRGAVRVEIPAASAGMTEMARAGMTGERAEADLVAARAASVPGAGRFPLGGGNDGKGEDGMGEGEGGNGGGEVVSGCGGGVLG